VKEGCKNLETLKVIFCIRNIYYNKTWSHSSLEWHFA